MAAARNIVGVLTAALLLHTGAAAAQSRPAWSDIRHPAMGEGSAVCTHSSRDGDVFCFGLRCSSSDRTPEWFTYQVGGDSAEGTVRVNMIVDERSHSTLVMDQVETSGGEWSFTTPYDAARHESIADRLRTGTGLYVLVDGVSGAGLSLRGSARALDRALAVCPAAPSDDETAVTAVGEPYDAVLAMARRQDCKATEDEVFNAVTSAGFGIWDANRFVVSESENGVLAPIGKTDGVHTYRVKGCALEADPVAVDPDATALSIDSDDLPQAVRQGIGEIAAMCGDAFLTEGREPDAVLADDVDGDGIYDFLLDSVQFCPSAHMTICGASHCPYTLLVSSQGAWRRFDFILQGYKAFTSEGFLFQCSSEARKDGVFMEDGKLVLRNCR